MSYSHPVTKQDVWVLEKLGPIGSFCEIGGYDGLTHSNTLLLEQQGWRGTLIEAVPEFFWQMEKNRPDAHCINACIGGADAHGVRQAYYVNGEWSGLIHHMPNGTIEGHRQRSSPVVHLQMTRLYDYVQSVHYLSLDTEGNELSILYQWFKDGGRCMALTVEFNYDQDILKELCLLCDAHGLYLNEIRGWDACFLRKGL